MKSTLVDESLSTSATRVLLQRKTTSLLQEGEEILAEFIDRITDEDQEIILEMITDETIIGMTIDEMITEDNDIGIEDSHRNSYRDSSRDDYV